MDRIKSFPGSLVFLGLFLGIVFYWVGMDSEISPIMLESYCENEAFTKTRESVRLYNKDDIKSSSLFDLYYKGCLDREKKNLTKSQ